ncbi:DUF1611 domain-containing protein [Nguyenibacter vanlangensis]|uniref:DUF1611 domain-containing protein n=1 Tax=Nguyenibacter vanlangensis TaxID=1216886 RepID=A0A7Y7IVQ7_9PROT|nr:DUF1611 domain-containing protein [Nguyenibacter vanlangensis]NVN11240.1 DUF1611 domain-containing protein [Nguyenibacter vanlangensis]
MTPHRPALHGNSAPTASGPRSIAKPYLVFLGDAAGAAEAKTGIGVHEWAGADCLAEWRTGTIVTLGLPAMRPGEARAAGARSLLIGVSPVGGALPDGWIPHLLDALEAGLDIVSGLHQRLSDHPVIGAAARRLGRVLHDVRHADRAFTVATGRKRAGKRVLTVGTDCALGKKYTALAVTRALRGRGIDADFRATGQTGIMIAGEGVAIDAVVADFIAGAAESLSPAAPPGHWDVIEGQGALFHPAYAGVTLGLLHGSQPDALILCHDPRRRTTNWYPDYPVPGVEEAMAAYLPLARRTNPRARFVGISLNTGGMAEADAVQAAQALAPLGLPVCDPLRFGLEAVVDRLLA